MIKDESLAVAKDVSKPGDQTHAFGENRVLERYHPWILYTIPTIFFSTVVLKTVMSMCYLANFRKCTQLKNVLKRSNHFFSSCKSQKPVKVLVYTKNSSHQVLFWFCHLLTLCYWAILPA
jgi:hypothetical protein